MELLCTTKDESWVWSACQPRGEGGDSRDGEGEGRNLLLREWEMSDSDEVSG